MALLAGTRLGPYEILAQLGEGGMGEVYRAKDTKLDREVAIKVLPTVLAQNPERLARFEREAKVLASLNHPNIAQIYGIEERALVMELVEGETLKGPLPVETALNCARQIADALEPAHEKGITHRDLKPANIMITQAGVVKVLDFGLAAVAQDPASGSANPSNSPTLTMQATQAGMIMGTAAYMSPEQAACKHVDKRADIWSFGVVLWEMLTGKRLFDGETISHTLADVLRGPIDFNKLPKETPKPIRDLLQRCLDRDIKTRLRDIGEARIAIQKYLANPNGPEAEVGPARPKLIWLAWGVAAFAMAGVAALAFVHFREHPPAHPRAYRLQLEPPEDGQFVAAATSVGGFAISPDGSAVVYVANVKGKTALWIHPLDSNPRMLPGTEDAGFPFWSPDGKSIAFFAGRKLLRTTVADGTPLVLCDVGSPRGGAWSEDGRIVFGTFGSGMFQVPESGGTPLEIIKPNASLEERLWPQVLSGGRLLYWNVGGNLERGAYAASLAKPAERVKAITSDTNALFAPGGDGKYYLLSLRGAALLAQEVDRDSLRLKGAPLLVGNPVGSSGNTAYMHVAASANGVLIYQPSALARFTWFDRSGKALGTVGELADYSTFRLSPDGRQVVASRLTPGGSDLWLLELERGISSPFSTGRGPHAYPVWSADGNVIVFSGPKSGLVRRPVRGTGQEMSLVPSSGLQLPYDWSRDGRLLLYSSGRGVWTLAVTKDGNPSPEAKPELYMERQGNLTGVRFSPMSNPQWIAYYSNESGRYEVYVQAFPKPQSAVRISTAGGRWPEWGPDGRELFYVSADNKLMSVSFKLAAALEPSAPSELFALPGGESAFSPYEVTPDGQRFLVRTPAEQASRSLKVIINWTDLLKRGTEAP